MKRRNPKHQRGAALLALLAVIMLGASWFLVSRLNAETGSAAAIRKERNVQVLNRAKQALIGYVAAQAAKAGENRPGALPCPEAAGSFGVAADEGEVSYPCTLPKVGRFPWKTLGLDKLVDASGEPLWYVVSPGWAGANTVINSNSLGQLTVDGAANDSVALIIAPGPAFKVAAATGCAAHDQVRPTSGTPDWRNYLECENATHPTPDAMFVTSGPSASFNDQVIRITVADIMPAIEAAIAHRIEREILPALQTVFAPAAWGATGTNPVLPFAAPFASPGSGAGTSNYQGTTGTYAGLLPFNQTQGCTPSATDPRCTTTFLSWSSGGPVQVGGGGSLRAGEASFPNTCSWKSADVYSCVGAYNATTVTLNLSVTVTNVAMGLRRIDLSKLTFTASNDVACSPCTGTTSIPYTASVTLNADGSATIDIAGTAFPDIATAGWGTWASYTISFDRGFIGDHALLDSSDSTVGWFARNEWYRLVYYSAAASNTAPRLPLERSCATAGDCLTVTTGTSPASSSALLVLAGRSVNGRSRPSATLSDYFEFGNANGLFERQTITPSIAATNIDTGTANAYAIPVSSLATGASLQFRAANANSGASTLTTAATGTQSVLNMDGTSLAAGTIQANAAVQVTWDGTVFRLAKRPFNDRVLAITGN